MFQTYIKNFHAKRTVTQTVAARKDALMDGVSSIFIRKKKWCGEPNFDVSGLMIISSVPMIMNLLFQHAYGSTPCEMLHCSPSAESVDLHQIFYLVSAERQAW